MHNFYNVRVTSIRSLVVELKKSFSKDEDALPLGTEQSPVSFETYTMASLMWSMPMETFSGITGPARRFDGEAKHSTLSSFAPCCTSKSVPGDLWEAFFFLQRLVCLWSARPGSKTQLLPKTIDLVQRGLLRQLSVWVWVDSLLLIGAVKPIGCTKVLAARTSVVPS